MKRIWPIGVLSAGAGVALLIGLMPGRAPAAPEPFFDPILSRPGAVCTSSETRKLLGPYRKLAATETQPFVAPTGAGDVADGRDPPLFANLGTLSYRITTSSPRSQRFFNQGLRFAYGFNHFEARRAFGAAQRHDSKCAMCYWGEALVLGPNINAPMAPGAVAPAMAAIRKAQENAGSASPRERALIAALARRYTEDEKEGRAPLDAAYADAMREAAARFAHDNEVQTLFAESLMDLTPWDYWEPGGGKPKGKTEEIVATLETVLKRSPNHPGAIHFYIHMMEASPTPERAVPYLRRLAAASPGNGHLVHMPFHIYNRIGDYRSAIASNRAAIAADEAYFAREKPSEIYGGAYYPHNIHSLMVSAQMSGNGMIATAAADKLARVIEADAVRTIPWVQPIKVAPYFAHAQFSPPRVTLAIPDPGDDLPFVKAMWHYARAVALAAQKNIPGARAETDAIVRLKGSNFGELALAIPLQPILDIALHVAQARIALAEDKLPEARAEFEKAAAIQDSLPYGEPPHWYFSVYNSLGAVLARLGELEAAEKAFKSSLVIAPNNAWAFYGLTEVYRRTGQKAALLAAQTRLVRSWTGGRRMLNLTRL